MKKWKDGKQRQSSPFIAFHCIHSQYLIDRVKINHLGTAFVSLLMFPHKKTTAEKYSVVPRVVVVASDVHYLVTVPESIVKDENEPILKKLGSEAYCDNK
jgi:hypothetical protein